MRTVDLICLAHSRKHKGCCVAGLQTDGAGWIRLVSEQPDGTLDPRQCKLNDGSLLQVLDVIRVPVTRPAPKPWQPENWVIASGRWQLLKRSGGADYRSMLQARIVSGPDLCTGTGKCVPMPLIKRNPVRESLALIKPRDARWAFGLGKKLRVQFKHGEHEYDLPVTDPTWETSVGPLAAASDGVPDAAPPIPPNCLFTISLGEPWAAEDRIAEEVLRRRRQAASAGGPALDEAQEWERAREAVSHCYKLAAAIFALPD